MTKTLFSAPARESGKQVFDVAIVGAGLGGSAAAAVLSRKGFRVLLVDRHETYPPDFRAEKLDPDQIDLIEQLGLLAPVRASSTAINTIINVRNGRVIDRTDLLHYSLPYEALVAALRGAVPATVQRLTGRVESVQTSPELQTLQVGGETISARLVVLATGLAQALAKELGIERVVHMKEFSVSIAFDVEPAPGEEFRFPALTCYGQGPSDRIDYLTLFPMQGRMRGNLFSFQDHRHAWTLAFRNDPLQTLLATMPGLERFLGEARIPGRVEVRTNSLHEIANYRQPGLVVIGDTFQTSCPAAGTGVTRALNDVLRLCEVHVPNWLATPGMSAAKIGQFYDDERKRAVDAHCLHTARFRRSLTTEPSVGWWLERRGRFSLRRVRQWARDTRCWALGQYPAATAQAADP